MWMFGISVAVFLAVIVAVSMRREKTQPSHTQQPLTPLASNTTSWDKALQHTQHRLKQLFSHQTQQGDAVWQHMEETLIGADVGVHATQKLLAQTKQRTKEQTLSQQVLLQALKQEALQMLQSAQPSPDMLSPQSVHSPKVWLFVGVNGAGKTTTIGKLAYRLTQEGKRVVIAAGDTFRAAAVQQLQTWAQRAHATCIAKQEGADPSSVLFEAVTEAKKQQADVVLCDTAGRLHSHQALMDQLHKMYRVLGKACAGAPHESLLVLDAHIGQNALMQAKQFSQAASLTGVVMAKLDGTAKGGVLLAIANELRLPMRYVGLGEAVEDLQQFDPQQFVDALFVACETSSQQMQEQELVQQAA